MYIDKSEPKWTWGNGVVNHIQVEHYQRHFFRVFSVGGGRIVEESSFSVPLTEEYESKIRAQIR